MPPLMRRQTIATMVKAEIERESNGAPNGNGSNGHAEGDQAASVTSASWSSSPREEQEPALSPNSRAILENRYLARDANNQIY